MTDGSPGAPPPGSDARGPALGAPPGQGSPVPPLLSSGLRPSSFHLQPGERAPYCELHAHTAFSFLEGASEPETLAERAAELGLSALAVTDRAGVYGHPRLYKAARTAGVEAIVGAEAVLADGSRLPLLVEDARGYSNLCRLLTDAALARKGHGAKAAKPSSFDLCLSSGQADWESLAAHASGLVALTGGEAGPLVRAWRRGGEEAAATVLERLVEAFGPERVAVEVQRHQLRGEEERNVALVGLARRFGVAVVATQDALAVRVEDGPLVDVFTCLREHCTLDAAGRRLDANRARVLRSPGAMARLWADLPEAVAATARIAARCGFRLKDLPYRFPRARLEEDRSEAEELFARTEAGARERYRTITPRVRAQLDRELSLIVRLGLAGYFLVVHDIVRFCRSRGIFAQGRGSAANSAVCYALGITAVDPIAMELLFERFLSEERGEWPDIDLDLPSGARREEVIQHVYRTYGERGAAMTANVITYRGRSAVREAGKVLGFAEEHLGRLSKLIGWGFGGEPREVLAGFMRQIGLAPEERRGKLLVELVARMLHLPRHLGQHSGGMVLARGRLDDVVPLEPAAMPGRTVIQWDKDDCADLGIIKVDLLGLGMLAALEEAVPLVREHEGVELDLAHLPPDDPATYEMIGRADTVGVFQIESRSQMATLPRMRPRRFYDLVVEVAIIRPGPIVGKMVHPYLNRRMGREKVVYPHPDLEPILERTLGVPLFQEQLMRVAMVAAGFSGGQAEELRRAMAAKRSVERMAKLERQLREGMAARGITGKAADDIVLGITSFALYGFPESHAASFALIAYASAYLKCHHPEAFLCALLNAWPMGFYQPATLIQDARRHGVVVLPIDVNSSGFTCRLEVAKGPGSRGAGETAIGGRQSVNEGFSRSRIERPEARASPRTPGLAVRLGLRFVRGLREEAARRIAEQARQRPFESVRDVAARGRLRQAELEALASIGAFASLGQTRRSALWQIGALDGRRPPLAQAMQPDPGPSPLPEMTLDERYAADYLGAGMTVGVHPLARRRRELRARGVLSSAELARQPHGRWVRVGGVCIVRQRPGTAKGMCFATLEDEWGLANVVFTPDVYAAHRQVITAHALLEVEGPVQSRDGVITVKALRCRPLLVDAPATPSRDFH
ncbi:MAG TPA: error-prone DNA polymerase [Thermoanaerobaculaceae bacterium]|nr:error-prone DNA polymerase [Thermoanaerobaculaceae bacterium]HRS16295.1 error-prone DNA polymerase [Thermoanaerobaculaceae bacterium]